MTKEKVIIALKNLGYDVIRIGRRFANVRYRDIYGQPCERKLDWRAMLDEGIFG